MANNNVLIGNMMVGSDVRPFIVAELGINHNGKIDTVLALIDLAVKAGVDSVKLQKRTVEIVYSAAELAKPREINREILKNAIQRGALPAEAVERLQASDFSDSQNGDLKFALEFSREEYCAINSHCRKKGILWFASCWDEDSVDFINQFEPPAYKIASACLTDDGLLRHTRSKGKPVILSTGMSTLEEIDHAVDVLGLEDLIILHSVSTYPTEPKELNLLVIKALQGRYHGVPVGYSGHQVGLAPSVMAVVLGACLIEQHFTLDRAMWGSDQAASFEGRGFELLVMYARTWEEVKGDGIKRVSLGEEAVKQKLRRK